MKKNRVSLVFASVLVSIALLSSGTAYAVVSCPSGYEHISGVCVPNNTGLSNKPVADILAAVLKWLLYLLTGFAVIGFVLSGLFYIIAGSDEGRLKTAKNFLTLSITGIVVALSGLVIIRTIANILSAANNSSII